VLSTFDLERQIEADGATWLDRRLVGRGPADLVAAGFGQVRCSRRWIAAASV
jgi:hypothetical protein